MDLRIARHRSLGSVGALLGTLVIVGACSAAATPSPSPIGSPTPASQPSIAPSSTPASTGSPTPIAAPTPTLPPTSAPSTAPTPSLAAAGPLPTGPWSTIEWHQADHLGLTANEVHVTSWSGGFIELDQSPGTDDRGDDVPVTIRASASRDGIHWDAPTTLQTGFSGSFAIRDIVEGPAGLLALAYPFGDTCGGTETISAMWRSTDGRSWKRVAMPKTFAANGVVAISGGAAGYIAFGGTGHDLTRPMIWTSADAATWTTRPLPTVSSGKVVLDQVMSFDRGFVLLGGVLGEDGCGGPAHIRPAVWFSTGGASWTRASLPGASTDPNAWLRMRWTGDHLLVVQSLPGDSPTGLAWTSTDGRTFASLGTIPTGELWGATTDGRHNVFILEPDSGTGPFEMTSIDGHGAGAPLAQTGDVPKLSADGPPIEIELGRTGFVAYTTDGAESWIGIPR